MKKIIVLAIIIFSLCGCSNENRYDDFEHYSLSEEVIISHIYIDDNGVKQVYAFADITPENYEMKINGLFYRITDNDYILLDRIENGDSIESSAYSYNNKLYINACNSACHWEYTLEQEKFSKKELKFDTSEIANHVDMYNIMNIKNGYIYWYGRDYSSENGYENWDKDLEIKCSLDNYKCELVEE